MKPVSEMIAASVGRTIGAAISFWLALKWGWWAFAGICIWEALMLIIALGIRASRVK